MGNKCCKNQSSTYSSANATIRSFSSYNSSILRSGGSHAITFGTSTRAGDSLTTLTMKSSNNSDVGSKDYRGGSSSTVGQKDLIPIFLRRLNDLNIRVGTRTRFLIELDDATGVQVRWYHNNVEADSERYQYIHEGGFFCLDIVPVTLFDEGLWVCTAQNYAGKSSTAAHLSLTVPKAFKKPIFVEQLKAVLTQRGIVSLECKVIGVPTPKLRWYKDDKEIKAGDIFALTANSEEDCLGIYTCEATNVMGTALSTSKIQVTHTPLDGNHNADSLIPYGPPPKFAKFLKNASGKVGSALFLECQVEVPPWPRSIGWYNDNGIVNDGPLYHLLADGLGMYGVEIKSLRADHSTTWKCVATSSTGAKAVTSCVVSVSYPKNYRVPRFLESLRAIMTDEGLVSFECKVIGYPTPQLLWFKDGKQLQPGDVYELTGSKSLGSYCCVARNCMGETSSLAELTIEDIQNQLNESEKLQLTSNTQPPRFLLGLKSIEANINESFVFRVKVTTESTPSISWYKEDEQVTETNRYQLSSEGDGTYILNIVPLEIDDQAEWKCVAINKYGQTATSSFLKLNIPKNFKSPRFLEELRIAFSNEGSVNLECKVIGVPQPQLKWFKDGQELNPGDMHKIISGQSGTCCLGTYTCQAHNCMGTVSSSATLLTMEDKSTVKSCASEEYLSVGNPLVRNESLSTIPEERTSQMEKSYTIEEPADISFSFDGKEVTVSLYETPDLTHDEALQIIEMYADELSEHISEDNVVDLPSLRIVKESSISGPVMMEALVIDVPIDFCRQQTVSDTEFDGISLTEDITLENNDKSENICENSLEYFSDHLSSGNSKREVFYSASETTPKNLSVILKQQSGDDDHQSLQTPKLFMSDSDDQILTQLKLDEMHLSQNSRHVTGPLARSESNNTEEEVSETLAEIENEPPLYNYCASEIVTQSDEDGLYSTVLNKIRSKGMASVVLSSEEDDVLKIISRPNVNEFLKYMKIILEGTMVKMRTHENFNFTSTTTELEQSIQALHSLAWKFIEETERNDVSELEKNTADNVSSLMTAINASLLALEQIDDPFGVSDNILNEIQSSVCFDLETLNNDNLPATEILDRLSDQIKNFTIVVNRQVARVTEQRIIAVLQNTIGTTLAYIKTLQQNCSKIKCVDINSLAPLFSMVQPLETILNDIAVIEEASMDDDKPNFKLKQILIPPISSIAFALDNLNTALKNDSSDEDQDLKDIYDRINESTNQFMTLASHGMESNKIAECFISFTKPINDLCCHLRRLGRSTENIVSSDYGSDDKLLLDFETLFDELMIDIDTLINNINFVQDSENNMNPLGSLLEPLQDMKIGLFQVNQVFLSNQTGSTMSYEVISCFEHLSQQLVQLNNCIVNQSIVEETDKEIPFESSIKMMQNILFDDAIDDLGVNGILFGSVMKPLLQLQNIIVSKMASVESDLSFSEHTDVTGGACDTQSLSLSLSNNAQTVLDKTANENSKQVITESSITDGSNKDCDKQNNINKDSFEIEKHSIPFKNNINNDLVIKRGFECDIVETFKCDEPNIITSEDDRENSGFEALFEEIDLETISDFVEDVCLDNIKNSKIDHKPSDLLMSEKYYDTMHKKTDDIIPEHVLEPLEKSNQQDLILNSPVDLFEEIQETLKNMSEVARDSTLEIYDLDNNTSNINDLQKNDLTYINQICDETNNLLDGSLDVEQNIENETFKNKCVSISDQNTCNKEQLFEIGQDVDFVENVECLDSDKSTSNNTVITVNDISDSSEFKMKIIDITNNLETVVDLLESKTGNVSQTVHNVSDKNEPLTTSLHNEVSKMNDNNANMTTSSDFKNESLDSVILNKLNSTESFKNITIHSSEDIIINTNKFNESEKMNTMNNYNDEKNEDAMLIKEVEILSITENVSHKSSPQDDSIVNEIDGIHNLGTDAVIQVTQTRNGNEYYMEKDEQNILINKCTKATELNKVLGILVEEKNVITPENNTLIEDYNFSTIIEDTTNKIKQCDNSDLLNKSICNVEESVIPANGSKSSIVDINLITILADNISKGFIEKQNCENENPSSLINKNNISDTFETNQDVNLNKKLQYDLQPNVNQTLTIDNKQIVPNCTNCENVENPKTELIVLQSEEHDFIKYDENESELINEEPLDNVQQNSLIVKENNILQQSINEEKIVKDLNEKCETLSDIKLKNEIKSISSKIVSPTEIIYPEHHIDVRNTIQQCVLGSTNNIIDDISITQYNVDNKCVDSMLPVIASMTQSFESNVLDKQLVTTNPNVEENQHTDEKSNQNKNIFENSFDSNNIIDDIAVKSKNNVINDFKSSVSSTLNEKATVSDEKSNSENKTTEIEINDVEKPIDKLNESYANLIQSSIFENNNATLSENALINSEIITLSTQSIDPFKFDENHVEIEFKKNIDSRYNHEGVSDDKENKINNLELFKAKNEFIYLPDETINKGEEKSTGEIQHIQNDEIKSIYESASIVVEQITALIDNEMISVSNAQSLDTIVTDFENIKKQEDVEDVIDTAKKNNQQRDVEKASKDKLISKILDTNNLTYDGNKPQKSIKNDYTEIQTSKSIDEKAKSVSNEDAVKKNDDILKTMNNLGTENVEENILTESQLSSKRGVDVYLTENDCVVTTFIDLETTKNNIEKVDNLKILASEINYLQVDNDQIVDLSDTKNDLAIHKCSFFVKENTEDCYEITSNSNTCIEISNENNANQHKQFTECKSKVMGNFETLERLSDQETLKTNTVNNEEKFNRNEDNLETNKTDDQNRIEYNTDKEQSPIIIDICKSLENNKFQINDKNQICLCDTKLENVNEKLREILEYNQDISDNNFEKSSDFKNNLGGTENLKNHEINSAEIQEEFINLKDLEVSKIVLETITDNTPKVEYNESKNQIKSSSFKNPPELVTDELNISSEIPNSECLFINKNVDGVNIESSNSNNSVTETLQINAKVDIIDQHTDISKTVTQDSADIRKDKSNATKDYPDHNQRRENTLPISEVRENQERNTINDNKEKEHSNITPDSINIHEDKLINEVKISDEINVVTALENKGSLLNDFIFQSEISDLSTKESFSILSIMPKLHCVEKIAANGTECVMLENTNILKQDELNATESVKQHAQVERELNIAAIGNIIMDYDSIKENSLTTLDEKKCIEKASITSTFDNNSFEIVSTNVNILDGPIKDMTIKEEQIAYSDTDEVSKISKKFTTLLSENKNPVDMAIHLLNDQIQNTDNLVQENINDKIALTNKTTGTLETNDHNQNNLNLNKEQSELADKLQQSIKNQNQIFESSIISVEKNDTMDKVKSDILITKVATTKDKKTIDTEDIVDINRKLSNESKKSETPNIGLSGNEIDTNTFINETIDQSTKEPSLGSNNTEKVEVKFCNLDPEIDSENNKNPEVINEISKDNQINLVENVSEDDKTKRGSKKKKSSLEPKIKKSPSPETTKSNISGTESNIDKIKVIDKSIEENNKILSDNGVDSQNVGVSLDKIRPEIIPDNNKVPDEIIEKDASNVNKNENHKKNEIGTDDEIKPTENVAGDDKTKRGSKKKKSSLEPIVKKSPSPETTKINISGSESNIDKIKVIDKSIEENNKILSDNGVDTQNVGVSLDKIRPEIIPDNNKVPDEIIEKDASNVDKNENHKKNEIGTDDEIEPTENVAEDYKTKRGSKKKKSSLEPKDKKSTLPNKINKKTNKKLEINNEIEKKENSISDLTENFIEQLPDGNIVLDKMEKEHATQSLEDNYIDIGKSKININDTHLLTNIDKCVVDNDKKERGSIKQETSTKSHSLEKTVRTDTINENVGVKPKDNTINCLTSNKKVQNLSGMTECDVIDVPEIRSLDKRPVNRYLLDVTDAHKSRPNSLAYRSLTPDPLTSYRSLTPDHMSSYRSLTPECPSYRSSLTPRSKYPTSAKYAGSSGRELYGGSSSTHSSRSSSRSTSPYPPESRISTRSLWPTSVAAYRCLSETSIPLSPRRMEVETTSDWPHTSYGVTTRRRRGSDSFLHDSGVRDGGYYSSWRLSDGRAAIYSANEDLYRTKEAFKGLHFCVRMIDQTVSSGARVKFWCSVIGHPEPRVQWYRDGQKLNSFTYNSSARYQTKYDGGLAQLIVENAQSGDSGEYTCVASNARDRISTTGFLTVYTSPSVFRKPLLQPSLSVDGIESGRGLYSWTSNDFRLSANDKFDFGCQKFGNGLANRRPEYPKFVSSIIADDVATYGGTIALQVRVQGSPVPNVTWMRESKPLPRLSNKYVYLDEGGLYTLLVMDSTAADGGKYVCRACNLYGVADTEKAVRVVSPQDYTDRRGVKPAIIVSRPNDRLNVAVGEDITVTLRVAGEPKPKVIWMRGSRDVTFLDRSLKETVNDYVMLSIKKAQPSDAGTYFIIAKNVYGSDRAFVTVGVRKRARSLTPPQIRNTIGRWLGPTDGGRGGRRSCANNEVPGPVRSKPTVTDRTNNRISLQWDRPEKPETVLVYRVETRSADEEYWRQICMTPTNSADVYNLKPGYRYQFRVAARNRFGWSQPVAGEGYVEIFEPKCLPEFRQQLPGQTRVLLRHSATLQCHVRGVPEPCVRWFKDGEPLLASDRHAIRRTDAGKCTLTIAEVVDCDAGRYSCEAVNDQGRVCTLTVVQVIANRRIVEAERRLQGCLMKNNDFKESAPVFTKHLIDRRVDINSTVRLSCQVNGLPTPLVLWYKDGRPIDFENGTEGDRKPPARDDSDDFYTLELTAVKYDDSGAYAAVASNAIGKASTRCVLEVFNKNRTDPAVPAFVFGLPPTSEAVDSIVLSAQIDAYRPVKVEWFRDGLKLRNGRRVDIITDHDGNLELRIACVTNRDSGTYMLRVSNDTGTIESLCDVNVVEREHKDTGMEQISLINHLYSKKPKFVVKPKFQEVEEGQEVIIDSEIVGDPLPKITWLRDGLKPEYYRDNSEFLCVSNGNRYQLKIPHAKLTHTGTYTLLAANPHGQIKALISLQVYYSGHCKKKMENGTKHATVERLPRISRGLVDIECRENDSVSFECKLNITQETDIRWQKDGKLVRLGKHIKSQLVDGDTARLDISTASPLHEGLYTCTAFNELGQDSTSARLVLLSDSQETAKTPQSNGQRNTMLNSPILAGDTNDRCTKRLKRSSAPKFYAVLHDRIADVGETVRFLCSVSGHPPPWSSWEKDGQPIGVNSRMRIREDDDHRSLEICDVTSDDAGLYRITVENKFGKIQATARLEVLTHNQTANDVQITSSSNGRRQSGSAACAGENFTLSCDIRGNSMSDVTWYKDDEKIKPDDRVTSSLDDLAARLSISNLESADTGVYTCVARCESGVTRCSTELCVFDTKPATDSYLQPPIFVQGLVPKRTADEGEPVQLTVRLQGAVPMSASWFKNDVPVPDCADFEYVVADDRGEFSLSITDPFVKDSGTYSCKVANSFGQAVSSGQLVINDMSSEYQVPTVIELNNNLQDVGEKTTINSAVVTRTALPASILKGPCDKTVLRGAKVVLETSYQGDPEPCVQWLRAGKVLESNSNLSITNERGVSSLTIDSITADDCGKYVVRVDNGHGNDFHYASVAVEGPPDPPAGRPVVSVSETSADVTWSSPAYDGGCMVTGYGVEVRPFNQSDWKLVADKCHSLSHIVRGLAPGESYVFRVRAENMHGSSEASLESTPVYILQTDYGNTLWPKTVNIENGELFDEQYEVLDELGKGRYGVVYKVKERETNKYYAAKFVRCIKSTDKEKAQEEVDIMNCLRHPKLLQLDAAFDKPREVVLVTEYISGGELFERVVADDFTLTEKDCILFTKQICEGVDYMHKQNVVHLDLKPENIMCQSRTSHYVKLIDFGLAQKIIPGQPMRVLFGTPEFIPPEIIGYEPIGLESDMWSVGVICYVLLSGLSPFMGDNDPETFTNITKAEFDFDDEAFDAVSQDAKDFISALLIKRKELRLTARECLKHKWLAQQDMDMSCVILSTDKLKKFIIRRKWQKTGNAIRALGRMATLSAASRRGVSGGSSAGGGGGGGTGGGCGTGSVLQKLKMACLREEESAGEIPSEAQEIAMTKMMKNGSGHKSCDARSDSGFSDCPSLASPTATLVRPAECPSAISEETSPVSDQDRSSPPPSRDSSSSVTRRSPSTTHRHPSSVTHRPLSPPLAGHRPSSPSTRRPSSPATRRSASPATRRPFSPSTRQPLSPTTRGSSQTATRGPFPLATHLRSPLPQNRRDTTHPVHDVPLPAGTGVSGICKTNRIIFDNGRRDGNVSSPGIGGGGGGVQRKEPIRIKTADNFQKAVAFWKQ